MTIDEINTQVELAEKLSNEHKFLELLTAAELIQNESLLLQNPLLQARIMLVTAEVNVWRGQAKESVSAAKEASALLEKEKTEHYEKYKAKALAVLGKGHYVLSDYEAALAYYFNALEVDSRLENKVGVANNFINIGNAYIALSDYSRALEYQTKALEINEQIGNRQGIAASLNNMGNVYYDFSDYPRALEYYSKALETYEQLENKPGVANTLCSIGEVYSILLNYPRAIEYYNKALELAETLGYTHSQAINLGNLGNAYTKSGEYSTGYEYLQRALSLSAQIGYTHFHLHCLLSLGGLLITPGFESKNFDKAEEYFLYALTESQKLGVKDNARDSIKGLTELYKKQGRWQEALEMKERQEAIEKEINAEQAKKQADKLEYEKAQSKREKEIAVERALATAKQEATNNLLHNILPAQIAERVLAQEKEIADSFENVTVFFSDFKSFTIISEKLTPQQLVRELHECFAAFDNIFNKYSIEKIKTVGDAYLCVAGLPIANPNHAEDMVKAALEIQQFMKKRKKQNENRQGLYDIRVGINSGSVVAGIVGVKKFAYDIWGDTVNTAARMEQNSEAEKINISQTTYELVKDKFNCEFRGEIEAKNKGKLKMYFVEGSLI